MGVSTIFVRRSIMFCFPERAVNCTYILFYFNFFLTTGLYELPRYNTSNVLL